MRAGDAEVKSGATLVVIIDPRYERAVGIVGLEVARIEVGGLDGESVGVDGEELGVEFQRAVPQRAFDAYVKLFALDERQVGIGSLA